MTFQQAEEIVKNITYKPGWKITIGRYYDTYTETELRITTTPQPDATGLRGNISPITQQNLIDVSIFEPRGLVQFISEIIRKIELHEMDEWLKLEGKWLKNPHPGEANYSLYKWGEQ